MDSLRFEAWTLPETGTFTRKLVLPVVNYQLQVRNSQIGSGSLTLADDFTGKDQILYIDPDDHTNDEGSLIRAFRDDTFLAEWYALRLSDTFSDVDPTLEVSGDGIELSLDKMRVLPYDHPDDPIREGDWIYGAESILDNTSFEAGGTKNELQSVWNDATGGTFRLSLNGGTNYTSPINYNATAAQVESAIEGLAAPTITNVDVTGTGDSWNPWVVEFIDPDDPAATFTADDASLTGGTTTITLQTGGGAGLFGAWTKSSNPVNGQQHGVYDTFEVSTDQARTGTYSLKIDGAAPVAWQQWPGAQQIIKVSHRTYRAEVWVYSTGTGPYRLVLRDLEENFIAGSGDITIPASTWTKISIPSFLMPAHISSMIFRIAYVGGANPPVFYVDDALFAPGFEPQTYGEIINDLMDDLNTHLTVGSWLTRTFTDALDSDGVAWDQDLSWAIKRGQSLRDLMDYAKRWGYEYRVRWNGTVHNLDLFNPGAMGTDYSAAATPAIVGRVTGSGPVVRRAPDFTWLLAEGDRGAKGIAEDTDLTGAFAKWMGYWPNKTAQDSTGLATAAAQRIADAAGQMEGIMVRVEDPPAGNLPLEDILVGDTVQVSLPGKTTKRAYRVAAVTVTGEASSPPVYEYHLSSMVFTPEAAVSEGVNILLREFRGLEDAAPEQAFYEPLLSSGVGGVSGFTIRVAASDAYQASKDAADYVCDGVDDQVEINTAILLLQQNGYKGRILLSEGNFYTGAPIVVYNEMHLIGMGIDATIITRQAGHNSDGIQTTYSGPADSGHRSFFRDFTLEGNKGLNTSGHGINAINAYAGCIAQNVRVTNFDGYGFSGGGAFSTGTYLYCESYSNDSHGFFLGADDQVWYCLAVGNGGSGAYLPSNNRIIGGEFRLNGSWGIVTGEGQHSVIVGNNVEGNSGGGIAVTGGTFGGGIALVSSNRVVSNTGGDGIRYGAVAGGDGVLIVGNICRSNSGWGISRFSGSGSAHVASNHTAANSSGAINLGTGDTHAANNEAPTGGIGAGGFPGADTTAIHDDVAAEISAVTAKATPTDSDYLLIEDAAAGDAKKSVTLADVVALTERESLFSYGGTLPTPPYAGSHRLYNRSGKTRTVVGCWAAAGTAPTGASIIVDVDKDGTTIYTTQANRPEIAISGFVSALETPDVTSWADGSYLNVEIDQVGSTVVGADLTVGIIWEEV